MQYSVQKRSVEQFCTVQSEGQDFYQSLTNLTQCVIIIMRYRGLSSKKAIYFCYAEMRRCKWNTHYYHLSPDKTWAQEIAQLFPVIPHSFYSLHSYLLTVPFNYTCLSDE